MLQGVHGDVSKRGGGGKCGINADYVENILNGKPA